jgi:hypothetical protein
VHTVCRPILKFSLRLGAFILMVSPLPSLAESPDEALIAFAVNVHRTPMQTWGPGYGIYLGSGVFITAAHVVGRGWWTRPKIAIGETEYPTRIIKEGSSEGTDVTLLAVEESLLPMRLQLRRNQLCRTPPWPGEEVITIVPEAAVHSHVMAPDRLPPDVRRFNTVIRDVATTGNSGSGVFDARQRCLLGIISKKISQSRKKSDTGKTEVHDIAKYFVPASTIAAFMPAEYRSLIAQ